MDVKLAKSQKRVNTSIKTNMQISLRKYEFQYEYKYSDWYFHLRIQIRSFVRHFEPVVTCMSWGKGTSALSTSCLVLSKSCRASNSLRWTISVTPAVCEKKGRVSNSFGGSGRVVLMFLCLS